MHFYSLLWLGAVVVIVTLFYRRFIIGAPWVAGLAAFFFAIDDAHAVFIAWLANRNALIALFFGVAALLFHDEWRRNQERSAGALAFLCFATALLSKESAIAICAYLFAYAVFIEQSRWTKRALSIAPDAFIVVVWRTLYRFAGYGAWGSKFYTDPLQSPFHFFKKLFMQVPVLLHGQWFFPPSEFFVLASPKGKSLFLLCSVAFLVVLFVFFIIFSRHDQRARFWFAGMMLALIPCF